MWKEFNKIWMQCSQNVKGGNKNCGQRHLDLQPSCWWKKKEIIFFMNVANKHRNKLRQPFKKCVLYSFKSINTLNTADQVFLKFLWNFNLRLFQTIILSWLQFCHCSTQRGIKITAFEDADSNLSTELPGETLDQSEAQKQSCLRKIKDKPPYEKVE